MEFKDKRDKGRIFLCHQKGQKGQRTYIYRLIVPMVRRTKGHSDNGIKLTIVPRCPSVHSFGGENGN